MGFSVARATLLASLACLLACGSGMPRSTAQAAAKSPFSAGSVWNAPLSPAAPVAVDSSVLVADLMRQVQGSGAWINTWQYSVPVYTVRADQPVIRVTLDVGYAPLQRDLDAVPLPPQAQPAAGSDAHLTVYQPASDTLWDFWKMRRAPDGWHARWGGKLTNVSTGPGYWPNGFGATATSLPLLGGLIRIDELRRRRIDHALALAIPDPKAEAFVWPAQRTDGVSRRSGAIPEGTRLQLDPTLDVNGLGLPPVGRAIAVAAQRYGIVVRDRAAAVTFYAEDPSPTGGNPYPEIFGRRYPSELLARFPWDRLRALRPPR